MIDVLHLIQLCLLRLSELAFPVFVKQFARPFGVCLRRSECNDFLRARATGKKLDDFAPVRERAVTVLLQTALNDFFKFCLLCFQPTSNVVGQINGHLHVRILGARIYWVNSGITGFTGPPDR